MRARWLLRRWYRTGLVEARLAGFAAPSAATLASNLGNGVVRLLAGIAVIAGAAVVAKRPRRQALLESCYTFCRGAGYAAGAVGMTRNEYAGHDGARRVPRGGQAATNSRPAIWPAGADRRATRETGTDLPSG